MWGLVRLLQHGTTAPFSVYLFTCYHGSQQYYGIWSVSMMHLLWHTGCGMFYWPALITDSKCKLCVSCKCVEVVNTTEKTYQKPKSETSNLWPWWHVDVCKGHQEMHCSSSREPYMWPSEYTVHTWFWQYICDNSKPSRITEFKSSSHLSIYLIMNTIVSVCYFQGHFVHAY